MASHTTHIVRNQSRRTAANIKLIILHLTDGSNIKGTADLDGLVSWFDNPSSGVSCHEGLDAEGNTVTMVKDDMKAWHVANFNSISLGIEQMGKIGDPPHSKKFWVNDYHYGLRAAARKIALWSIKHDIPIKHSTSNGVCQHKDLGELGGNHDDCGPTYPERYVLVWAQLWRLRFLKKNTGPVAAQLKVRLLAAQKAYGNKLGTM